MLSVSEGLSEEVGELYSANGYQMTSMRSPDQRRDKAQRKSLRQAYIHKRKKIKKENS